MITAVIKRYKKLWVFIMWPSLEARECSERQGQGRGSGRNCEEWSLHNTQNMVRRETKLCWCLWTKSPFSQMRHSKSFRKCVLAHDRKPNPDWPKVTMEFTSLHERDESGVAPAKLDLGAQTVSSGLSVVIASSLCFLLCQLSFFLLWLPTLTEKYLFTSPQVQVQEDREMPHFHKLQRQSQCICWFWPSHTLISEPIIVARDTECCDWLDQSWGPHLELWMVSLEALLYRRMKEFWAALTTDVQCWFLKCCVL